VAHRVVVGLTAGDVRIVLAALRLLVPALPVVSPDVRRLVNELHAAALQHDTASPPTRRSTTTTRHDDNSRGPSPASSGTAGPVVRVSERELSPDDRTGNNYISVQEAAQRLGLSIRTVQRLAANGQLKAHRTNIGTWRIDPVAVDLWTPKYDSA
jgi:excisionase family DNA binding protein